MTPTQRTLLIILAFVTLTLGSFIWYIATWDPSERAPVSTLPAAFLFAQNIPGGVENSLNFRRGAAPHIHRSNQWNS